MPVTFDTPADAASKALKLQLEARGRLGQLELDLRSDLEQIGRWEAGGWISPEVAQVRTQEANVRATQAAQQISQAAQRALQEIRGAVPSEATHREELTGNLRDAIVTGGLGLGVVSGGLGLATAGAIELPIAARRALGPSSDRRRLGSAIDPNPSALEQFGSSALDYLLGSTPEQRISRAIVERPAGEALDVAAAANRRDRALANRTPEQRFTDVAAGSLGRIAGMWLPLSRLSTLLGGSAEKGIAGLLPKATKTATRIARGAAVESGAFAGTELAGGAPALAVAESGLVGGVFGAARPAVTAALGARAATTAGRATEVTLATAGIAGLTYAETGDLATALGAAAGLAPLSALGLLERGRAPTPKEQRAARAKTEPGSRPDLDPTAEGISTAEAARRTAARETIRQTSERVQAKQDRAEARDFDAEPLSKAERKAIPLHPRRVSVVREATGSARVVRQRVGSRHEILSTRMAAEPGAPAARRPTWAVVEDGVGTVGSRLRRHEAVELARRRELGSTETRIGGRRPLEAEPLPEAPPAPAKPQPERAERAAIPAEEPLVSRGRLPVSGQAFQEKPAAGRRVDQIRNDPAESARASAELIKTAPPARLASGVRNAVSARAAELGAEGVRQPKARREVKHLLGTGGPDQGRFTATGERSLSSTGKQLLRSVARDILELFIGNPQRLGIVPQQIVPFSRTAKALPEFLESVRSTWNARGRDSVRLAHSLGHRVRMETGLEREASRPILKRATGKPSFQAMTLQETERAAQAVADRPGITAQQRQNAARVIDQIRELRRAGETAERAHAQEARAAARAQKTRAAKFRTQQRKARQRTKAGTPPEPPKAAEPDAPPPAEPVDSVHGPYVWDMLRARWRVFGKWEPKLQLGSKFHAVVHNAGDSSRRASAQLIHGLMDRMVEIRRQARDAGTRWRPTPEVGLKVREILESNPDPLLDATGAPATRFLSDARGLAPTDPTYQAALAFRRFFNESYLRLHTWDPEAQWVDRVALSPTDVTLLGRGGRPDRVMTWAEFGRTPEGREVIPMLRSRYRHGYYPKIRDFAAIDDAGVDSIYGFIDDMAAQQAGRANDATGFKKEIKNRHSERRTRTINEEIIKDPWAAYGLYVRHAAKSLMTPALRSAGEHLNRVTRQDGGKGAFKSEEHARIFKFGVRWSEQLLGIPSDFDLTVARTLDQVARHSRAVVRALPGGHLIADRPSTHSGDVLRMMVSAAYPGALGGRPDVPLRNILTQGPGIFVKLGPRYTLAGFRDFLQGVGNTRDERHGRLLAWANAMRNGDPSIQARGVVSQTIRSETVTEGLHPFVRWIANGSMFAFDTSEVLMRSSAYLGGYRGMLDALKTPEGLRSRLGRRLMNEATEADRARIRRILKGDLRLEDELIGADPSRGVFKQMSAEQQAAHVLGQSITSQTQFIYGPEVSPAVTSNSLGRAIFQFQSYPVNMADFMVSLVRGSEPGSAKGLRAFRFVLFSLMSLELARQIDDADESDLLGLDGAKFSREFIFGPVTDPFQRGGIPVGPAIGAGMDLTAAMFSLGQDIALAPSELLRDGAVSFDPTKNAWKRVDRDALIFFPPALALRRAGVLPEGQGLIGGSVQRAREAVEAIR